MPPALMLPAVTEAGATVTAGWLLLGLTLGVVGLACGVLGLALRRRDRRRPSHRATRRTPRRNRSHRSHRAHAGPPAAADTADAATPQVASRPDHTTLEDLDHELQVLLEQATPGAGHGGDPDTNRDLDVNPATGQAHIRRRVLRPDGPAAHSPARRRGYRPGHGPAPDDRHRRDDAAAAPALHAADQLNEAAGTAALTAANDIAAAWHDRDVDQLNAIATSAPDSAGVAHLLAAAAAAHQQDPRAFRHLQAAYDQPGDATCDAALAPFADQITFHVRVDALGLGETLSCTRVGLGCALAAAELAAEDPASAYGVLLGLDDEPLAALLRAHAALLADWPDKALRDQPALPPDTDGTTDEAAEVPGRFAALRHYVAAQTHLRLDDPTSALAHASAARDLLEVRSDQVGPTALPVEVHLLTARAHLGGGDADAAWTAARAALQDAPGHPGALELLKAL